MSYKFIGLVFAIFLSLGLAGTCLFFGFSPDYGKSALYGPRTCDVNASMICIDACTIGCLNLMKNKCETFKDSCHGSRFCILKIDSYYYVNNPKDCPDNSCYQQAMCIRQGSEIVPWNLEYLSSNFKGSFWGIILVIIGMICVITSIWLFVLIVHKIMKMSHQSVSHL